MQLRRGSDGDPTATGASDPDQGTSAVPLARRFTVLYLVALAAVLTLALVSQTVIRSNLERVESTNERLALAAEQPAKVHRIARIADLAARAAESEDPEQVTGHVEELTTVTEELREVQAMLGEGGLDQPLSAYASTAQLFVQAITDGTGEHTTHLATLAAEQGRLVSGLEEELVQLSGDVQRAVDDQRRANDLILVAWVALAGVCGLVLFAPMARSIRVETSALEEAETRHREASERQFFQTSLKQAFELCSDEQEVIATAERALVELLPSQPADVLLEDGTRSSVYRAGSHGVRGPAGCPVDTPEECAALRSGQPRTYPTSRQVNTCPKLPLHDQAPCSAVCIPMVFNGDGVGVLHTTGPDGTVPDEATLERLQLLSEETGARLGTLRITRNTRRMAERDALTDLDNRRTLLDKAHLILSQHRNFALAMADLDEFKALNDTHGHEQGDRSLRLFADVLSTQLRPDDVAARFGGEEFVVILPATSITEAAAILERLQAALAEQIQLRNAVPFTASWGLTDSGEGSPGFQELLNRADAALYEAKRAGRNRVVIHADATARHRRTGDPFDTTGQG